MNPDTIFSVENLIDISFLAVTACARFSPCAHVGHFSYPWFKKEIYCEGLRSYIRQNFGFSPLLTKIVCCLAKARQQLKCALLEKYAIVFFAFFVYDLLWVRGVFSRRLPCTFLSVPRTLPPSLPPFGSLLPSPLTVSHLVLRFLWSVWLFQGRS